MHGYWEMQTTALDTLNSNNPIKSENMKIFRLNNSVNSWMDFFYLSADSHKYSIPDLEKIRYLPSLFCICKKLITQRSIHRTLSRICPQWHETHPTTYIMVGLDDILRYRLMLNLYNSWPSQTHAQSLRNTMF